MSHSALLILKNSRNDQLCALVVARFPRRLISRSLKFYLPHSTPFENVNFWSFEVNRKCSRLPPNCTFFQILEQYEVYEETRVLVDCRRKRSKIMISKVFLCFFSLLSYFFWHFLAEESRFSVSVKKNSEHEERFFWDLALQD